LKEVYDHAHLDKHTPDIFDIIATSLGGMVGAISTATFLWYFT
jgi:glycopeptide antibiotics resistance protein